MLLDYESSRLSALRDYDVLDTPVEEEFDRITAMGARLFDAALCCITLVDKDRFFFKSSYGSDVRNLAREPGFCDTVIQQAGVYCIEDTAVERRVQNHSMVCNEPYIKSYAGSPLITSDGLAIGTLCVMDTHTHAFTAAEKKLLQELAEFVMFHLDRRKLRQESDRREQDRQDLQKLESLGMLAGGVAHDFNNLLVGVLGNAALTARQIEPGNPAQEAVADIVQAANQASELTDQLLAYAGQRPTSPIPVDVAQLLDNLLPLLRSSVGAETTIEIVADDALPAAIGDPTQLRQVLLNLVTNASDAYCGNPGFIRLQASPTDLTLSDIQAIGADVKAGAYVRIEIEDFGSGMDAETLNSVFSPFFSTKVSGRGLGMSIVRRIVRGHQGVILVESIYGHGSKVTVMLPADTNVTAVAPDRDAAETQTIKGTGTVLIVDDEELVMKMTSSAVQSFGFDVCKASSGAQALERVRRHADVHALILDATMPGMNGMSTLDAVRKYRPDLPTVITSGHHIDEVANRFQDFDKLTFLHKPWTLEQLSNALQDAMSGQVQG